MGSLNQVIRLFLKGQYRGSTKVKCLIMVKQADVTQKDTGMPPLYLPSIRLSSIKNLQTPTLLIGSMDTLLFIRSAGLKQLEEQPSLLKMRQIHLNYSEESSLLRGKNTSINIFQFPTITNQSKKGGNVLDKESSQAAMGSKLWKRREAETNSSELNIHNGKQHLIFCVMFIKLLTFNMNNPTASRPLQYSHLELSKGFLVRAPTLNLKQAYQVSQDMLGSGAFGTVYKGTRRSQPHYERAIKVIPKKNLINFKDIRQEVQVLKNIDHPNIDKLYEYEETPQAFNLVLNLWEGKELHHHLHDNGPICQEKARRLFGQVVRAVNYLHSIKICHRDIKPQNLLFDKEKENLCLVDFGLAFLWKTTLPKDLQRCGQNESVGTASYVAPEVLDKDYDQRCDIWSLGVVLYEMATAKLPFRGKDTQEILEKVCKMEIERNAPFQALSEELKDLITSILAPKQQRLSIQQILEHPWMKGETAHEEYKFDYQQLKNFAGYSHLKKIIFRFIASLLSSEELFGFRQPFSFFDSNSDGVLTADELEKVLKDQGLEVSRDEIRQTLNEIGLNTDEKLTFMEFVAISLGEEDQTYEQYLGYIFQHFNIDETGSISIQELQDQLSKMGFDRPKRLSKQVMTEGDIYGDGAISFKAFIAGFRDPRTPSTTQGDDQILFI